MSERPANPDRDRWFDDAKNADIVRVAESMGVSLKKAGRDFHSACPVCGGSDKNEFVLTPGNEPNKRFLCRKAGEGGDVIAMVRHAHGIPDGGKGFVEACEIIMGGPPPGDQAVELTEEEKAERAEQRRQRDEEIAREAREREEAEAERKLSEYEKSLKIWESGLSITGTPVAAYLRARNALPTPERAKDYRYVPDHPFWCADEEGKWGQHGRFPAMVLALRDPETMDFRGIHQTYIDADNPGKKIVPPPGEKPKKMRGEAKGAMIFLGDPTEAMAIGEGAETTESWFSLGEGPDNISLATSGSLGNLAGGSTGTVLHPDNRRLRREMEASGKKATDTRIPNGIPDMDRPGCVPPPEVKEVYLLVDGDSDRAKTFAHVLTAARRYREVGLSVFVHVAPDGLDFNDLVMRRAAGEDLAIPAILTFEEFEKLAEPMVQPWALPAGLRGTFVHLLATSTARREWIVKGALQARSLHIVVGEPGCGKSFLISDLGLNLAWAAVSEEHSGQWFGRVIKPCGVVYVAAEGQDDFQIRIRAWLQSKGIDPETPLPFILIPTAIDMRTGDVDTKRLIQDTTAARKICMARFKVDIGLVIIDTLNRALAGGDDAKAEHVGAFIRYCSKIKDECEVAVMPVAHVPKAGGSTDPRGHGSLKGDNDGQWYVSAARDGAPNRWTVTRLKAGPSGDRHEFRLRQTSVGKDDDGDPITSCIVVPQAAIQSDTTYQMRDAEEASQTNRPNMTPDGRVILNSDRLVMVTKALQRAMESTLDEFPPPDIGVPHGRMATTFKHWLDKVVEAMPGEDKDTLKFRDRCRKAMEAAFGRLDYRGLARAKGDWVWRTDRRIAGIDQRIQKSEAPAENSETEARISELAKETEGVGF